MTYFTQVLDQKAGVERFVKEGLADASRVGICGWSYGGMYLFIYLCMYAYLFVCENISLMPRASEFVAGVMEVCIYFFMYVCMRIYVCVSMRV